MTYRQQIKAYFVHYIAGAKNLSKYPYRAIIGLTGDKDQAIGVAYFHRSPDTMPKIDYRTRKGHISCHFTWEHFGHVLDLLRNEKPVYVWYDSGMKHTYISTNSEPIGEGETGGAVEV